MTAEDDRDGDRERAARDAHVVLAKHPCVVEGVVEAAEGRIAVAGAGRKPGGPEDDPGPEAALRAPPPAGR